MNLVIIGPFGYNLFYWKHYKKIIFKCVNSAVGPMNSTLCLLHSESMCGYCSYTLKKKKKNVQKQNADVNPNPTYKSTIGNIYCTNQDHYVKCYIWENQIMLTYAS